MYLLCIFSIDISNVIEWGQPPSVVSIIRKVFNANLSTTIVDLLNCTEIVPERFGIAGPGLLGEDQFIIPAL